MNWQVVPRPRAATPNALEVKCVLNRWILSAEGKETTSYRTESPEHNIPSDITYTGHNSPCFTTTKCPGRNSPSLYNDAFYTKLQRKHENEENFFGQSLLDFNLKYCIIVSEYNMLAVTVLEYNVLAVTVLKYNMLIVTVFGV